MTAAPEMVERVSAALRASDAYWWSRADEPDDGWAETLARAALEAMREPTERMVSAVYNHPGFLGHGDDSISWIWKVMCDAALRGAEPAISPGLDQAIQDELGHRLASIVKGEG